MMAVKEISETYLSHFARREKAHAQNEQHWLHELRRKAISRFAELGFPTAKLEEWKFTNVGPLARTSFHSAEFRADGMSAERLADLPLAQAAFSECCSRIVFVNGHYNPQLSSADLPEGVIAGSLGAAIKRNTPHVQANLARHADFQHHAFVDHQLSFEESWIIVNRGMLLLISIYASRQSLVPRLLNKYRI